MKRREALFALGAIPFASSAGRKQKLPRSVSMKKEIKTGQAPQAIGPYSQGIAANGFVFCSGQIPLVPETGLVIEGGIEEQTRRVLQNLSAVLQAAGSSLDQAVKCTVFLQDMNDFAAMNKVYAEFFKSPAPARAAVQVARLPKDVKVEIEAVAILT
jgi:2-iminobutanoate/2-iminopropanoate deaminase